MKNTSAQIVQIWDIKRKNFSKESKIWGAQTKVLKWYENAFRDKDLIVLKKKEEWISFIIYLILEENRWWLNISDYESSEGFFRTAIYVSNFLYDLNYSLPKWTRIKNIAFEQLDLEWKIQKCILNEIKYPLNDDDSNYKNLMESINEWIDKEWDNSDFPIFLMANIDMIIYSIWELLDRNLILINL